jgi:hypothetical protein
VKKVPACRVVSAAVGEGLPHKHEHRLDGDEMKPLDWFTRTALTNGHH